MNLYDVPDVRPLPRSRRDADVAMLVRLAEESAEPRRLLPFAPARLGRHRRTRLRLAFAAAAAATVSVAAAAGVLTLDTGQAMGSPALPEPLSFTHGSHDSAVAVLLDAANAQATTTPGMGPITYAKTRNYALQVDVADHTATTTVETTVREVWVSHGSGMAKTARQNTTRSGVPVGSPTKETTDMHWQDNNSDLPTAAAPLRAALLGAAPTGGDTAFVLAQAIMSSLAQGTTTAAQTAALYRVLATMPGVFDAGAVTDNAGRAGRAVGIQTGYFDAGATCAAVSGAVSSQEMQTALADHGALGVGTTYLVLDPSTGQPLQIESLDTPNAPCGLRLPAHPTIEQYSLILETGQVSKTGATVS